MDKGDFLGINRAIAGKFSLAYINPSIRLGFNGADRIHQQLMGRTNRSLGKEGMRVLTRALALGREEG